MGAADSITVSPNQAIRVTRLQSWKRRKGSHTGHPLILSWQDLAKVLTVHTPHERKDGVDMIFPGNLPKGIPRSKKAAETCRFPLLPVDVDHAEPDAWDRCVQALEERGCAYAMATSYSHTPAEPCLRAWILLSRPVTAHEFRRLHAWVPTWWPVPSDSSAKDVSRAYYMPSAPPERLSQARRRARVGRPSLDVEMALREAPEAITGGVSNLPQVDDPRLPALLRGLTVRKEQPDGWEVDCPFCAARRAQEGPTEHNDPVGKAFVWRTSSALGCQHGTCDASMHTAKGQPPKVKPINEWGQLIVKRPELYPRSPVTGKGYFALLDAIHDSIRTSPRSRERVTGTKRILETAKHAEINDQGNVVAPGEIIEREVPDRPETPGRVQLITAPTGLGKTHATLAILLDPELRGRRLLICKTHALIDEAIARGRAQHQLRSWRRHLGIDACRPDGARICVKPQEVDVVTRFGHSARELVCQSCDSRDICEAHRGFRDEGDPAVEPQFELGTHEALLRRLLPSGELGPRGMMVADEMPELAAADDYSVEILDKLVAAYSGPVQSFLHYAREQLQQLRLTPGLRPGHSKFHPLDLGEVGDDVSVPPSDQLTPEQVKLPTVEPLIRAAQAGTIHAIECNGGLSLIAWTLLGQRWWHKMDDGDRFGLVATVLSATGEESLPLLKKVMDPHIVLDEKIDADVDRDRVIVSRAQRWKKYQHSKHGGWRRKSDGSTKDSTARYLVQAFRAIPVGRYPKLFICGWKSVVEPLRLAWAGASAEQLDKQHGTPEAIELVTWLRERGLEELVVHWWYDCEGYDDAKDCDASVLIGEPTPPPALVHTWMHHTQLPEDMVVRALRDREWIQAEGRLRNHDAPVFAFNWRTPPGDGWSEAWHVTNLKALASMLPVLSVANIYALLRLWGQSRSALRRRAERLLQDIPKGDRRELQAEVEGCGLRPRMWVQPGVPKTIAQAFHHQGVQKLMISNTLELATKAI